MLVRYLSGSVEMIDVVTIVSVGEPKLIYGNYYSLPGSRRLIALNVRGSLCCMNELFRHVSHEQLLS